MRKERILKTIGYLALLLFGMFYGVLVGKFQFPPYSILKAGYNALTPEEDIENSKEFTEIPEEYLETDVNSLISFRHTEGAARQRERLIRFLWGRPGLPASQPDAVIKSREDDRYSDIESVTRIDELVVKMAFGLESHVYHFIPKNPNNKIVLYHQGHQGDFIVSKEQIRQLTGNRYAVAAFSMPLLGPNNQPVVEIPGIGRLKITTHDHLEFLSPEAGHPIKFFIEPVIIALNYFQKNFNYSALTMAGISGGGWTTTLAAAADPRIIFSFPVAGSYPIYLRSNSETDWGDYEQVAPALYKTVNYPELYVLGAHGMGRKQLQVINQYDDCCFAGMKWQTYKNAVETRVRQLGTGRFDIFLDTTHHGHYISDAAMHRLFYELDNL